MMNLAPSLIGKILTRKNAIEMADKLGTVASRSFENKQTLDGLLKEYFDEETYEAILETIKNSQSKTEGQGDALNEMKSTIENLPNLRLSVAIKPTVRMVESFCRVIRKEVNPLMTLEFDVDPKIIGGAIIVSNGKIFDYSLKKKITDFFDKNKDKLIKRIH